MFSQEVNKLYKNQSLVLQITSFKVLDIKPSSSKAVIKAKINLSDGYCQIKALLTDTVFDKFVSGAFE
jgi:hypothetical protein